MKTKKIAIIGLPPLSQIVPDIKQKGWYGCVWFIPIFEAFKQLEQYEVHWISITKEVSRKRYFRIGNQFLHVYPSISLNWAEKTHYFLSRILLMQELKRIQPDLVHVWGTEGYFAMSAKDWPGPKLLSMQGILTICCERAKMSSFFQRQARHETLSMQAYDLITVESQWGLKHVQHMVPGVPTRRWEYAVQAPFFAAKRHLAERPFIVMAGTNLPVKNAETALKAFADPRLAHVDLVMAGVASDLHPGAPPNVKFPGGLSRPAMVKLLSSAWGIIHPSLADTSPNIVKEARVIGLPAVISSECGGVQYVEHGKSGFIVDPLDVEGCIAGVAAMTQNVATSLRMGAHGQAECRRLLSAKTMMEELLKLYDEMLNLS